MGNRFNSEEHESKDSSARSVNVLLTDTNRWAASARLAIALSEAGCSVSAVCRTNGHPLRKTRAVRMTFPYHALRPLESLAAAIEAAQPDLIIPCDDLSVEHLHQLHASALSKPSDAALAALIERSLGAPESYPVVLSRYDLLRAAAEEKIPVPQTIQIGSVEEAKSLFLSSSTAWVLKADGTWGGRGVRFTESKAEAERNFLELTSPLRPVEALKQFVSNRDRSWLLARAHRRPPAVIAQACIHGRPANCAVLAWQGTILAGVAVEVLSSSGDKGPAIVVRLVEGTEMLCAAERLARRLRLSGVFGLDFMIEEGTNAVKLIEMNPRCTPLCHLQLGPGRDLVGALWAQLTGQTYRPPAVRIFDDLIAYFPQAWTTKSTFLEGSFQDIPHQDPALCEELLNPWSERSLVGRLLDGLRSMRGRPGFPAAHIFPEAIPLKQQVEAQEVHRLKADQQKLDPRKKPVVAETLGVAVKLASTRVAPVSQKAN